MPDALGFDAVAAKVFAVIGDELDFSADKISLASTFAGDLAADSMDMVSLISAVECDFGDLVIPDAEIEKLVTVRDLVELILRLREEEGAS